MKERSSDPGDREPETIEGEDVKNYDVVVGVDSQEINELSDELEREWIFTHFDGDDSVVLRNVRDDINVE